MTNYYTKQARIERLEKENQKLRDEMFEMAKQIVELQRKLILEKDRTITIMDDRLLWIKTDGWKWKFYKEDDDNIVLY